MTGPKEEYHGLPVEPDVLVAFQFLGDLRGPATQERQLRIAILADAIRCFQKHLFTRNRRERQLFCEAEQWIMDENTYEPFSFEQICDALDLDADYVRRGILRWRQQQVENTSSLGRRAAES